MRLTDLLQSKVRFHLGYGNGSGIPHGDLAQLEAAFALVRDDYQYKQIVKIIDRCDRAFERTELGEGVSTTELYVGDVNRSIQRTDNSEVNQVFLENYLIQTNFLAQELNVPNYRDYGTAAYRFQNWYSGLVERVIGPADTSVGSRIYMARRFG